MKNCIIVLGMHRSGTSIATGFLSHFKLSLGKELIKANEENPKGFFENKAILSLNKEIMNSIRSDWDDHLFSLDLIDKESQKKWAEKALDVLNAEFLNENNFTIKDPRLCLLFPIWEQALNKFNAKIKVIITYRHPCEVSSSLSTRNGLSQNHSFLLWSNYLLSSELYSRKHKRIQLNYPHDFQDSNKLINKLSVFTKINIDSKKEKQIESFYDKNLTRHNCNKSLANNLPPYINKLISLLEEKQLTHHSEFDSISKDFYNALFFYNPQETDTRKKELYAKKSTEVRQRNELIQRLEAEINNLETISNNKIALKNTQINKLNDNLSTFKQQVEAQCLNIEDLTKKYIKNRESHALIKSIYKYKKDKRLIKRIKSYQAHILELSKEISDSKRIKKK